MFLLPSLFRYASYLVWKDLGGGFRQPLALPLGLYAAQLTLSWTVLTLFFVAHTPGLVRRTGLGSGSSRGKVRPADPQKQITQQVNQAQAGSGWADVSEPLWNAQSPGNLARWVPSAAERSSAGSQGSMPERPALCPGPPAPAAALRAGGEHSADLAPRQQAGRPAPAALPGLAHRDRVHCLPPVEGKPLSRAPASAHGGEEPLRGGRLASPVVGMDEPPGRL